MSSPEKSGGPKVGQSVLYNNAGAIVSGVIYRVLTTGLVDLTFFSAAGATAATSVPYNATLSAATSWAYPDTV